MKLKTVLLAATASMCLVGGVTAQEAIDLGDLSDSQPSEQTSSVLDGPKIKQLSDQDIDPNDDLLEALRLAARKGPIFRISPQEVSLEVEVGQTGSRTIRLTNSGDETGLIKGVNAIGSLDGLQVANTCSLELEPGEYCELEVTYMSQVPRSLETVIVGTINERNRKSLDIPVSIEVLSPPPQVVEEPVQRPIVVAPPQKPAGPTSSDIAKRYFSSQGGASLPSARVDPGFVVISKSNPQRDESFAGVAYEDMRIDTVRKDDRFDADIPNTEASLPVDRDRILTSDRVIKAVLETPVSNIMCAKAVAVVESDVYSATSSVPLIKAGSRVIGECQDFVDERAGISWTRILTTDGRSITFADADADTNDAMGHGGALGREYQSKFDQYILPIFSTMIDTAAGVIFATFGENEEVTIDPNGNAIQSRSAKNEGVRIVTDEARSTAQEIIKDIRDVRKVVVVPAGSRIDIEIREDIYFREDKKVVRLADMSFDLEDISVGSAQRDIPNEVTLVPADKGYDGPVVMIDGRAFKLQEVSNRKEDTRPSLLMPTIDTQQTLSEISGTP
jgi:type IV secretory pathway VirB10-like protein